MAQVMQLVTCVGGPLNGRGVEVPVGEEYFTCQWEPSREEEMPGVTAPVVGCVLARYQHLPFGRAVCVDSFHGGWGGRA